MNKSEVLLPTIEELTKAGVHLGHKTTKWHPRMAEYILGIKNTIHILDLEKTREKLKQALNFLKKVAQEGGVILFVGTTPPARKVIEEIVVSSEMPYVIERWLGGTITNFKTIAKRIEYLKELIRKRDSGELEKYTKKEQHRFDEEIKKLERKFGGLKQLTRIPDVLIVLDAKKNQIAIREAARMGVKIIAICDTNVDPKPIDYPIPANDNAISSLKLIVGYLMEAIKEGKKSIKQ